MIFKNTEKFEEFLRANVRHYNENVCGYLMELEKQWGEAGVNRYELSKFETNSGRPECIDFEVEYREVGEEFTEITIIF